MDARFLAAGALAVLIFLAAAVRFATEGRGAPAELIVWAPDHEDAQVSLDGAAPVTVRANSFWVFDAKRGAHQVRSTIGAATFSLDVEVGAGDARYAVPIRPQQCFAVAEVTRMYTSSTRPTAGPPRLHARLSGHGLERLPKGTFLTDVPDSTLRSGELYVVRPFDCDDVKVADAQLLEMMGL